MQSVMKLTYTHRYSVQIIISKKKTKIFNNFIDLTKNEIQITSGISFVSSIHCLTEL